MIRQTNSCSVLSLKQCWLWISCSQEMKQVQKARYLEGINFLSFFCFLKLVMLLFLISFLLEGGIVRSVSIFVTLSLFNSLRIPLLIMVPEALRIIAEFSIIFLRLEVGLCFSMLTCCLVPLLCVVIALLLYVDSCERDLPCFASFFQPFLITTACTSRSWLS